jgi:hypothetical protein
LVELGASIVAFVDLNDENLLAYYDNIRDQVARDKAFKFRMTSGPSIRQHADELRSEIVKRRLQHAPIDWHSL